MICHSSMECEKTYACFIRETNAKIRCAAGLAGGSCVPGRYGGVACGMWAKRLGRRRAGDAARRDAGAGAGGEKRHDSGHDGIPVGTEVATFGEYQSSS